MNNGFICVFPQEPDLLETLLTVNNLTVELAEQQLR